eukprot:1559997-Pyramimonas_sp.AAC.1
MRPCCNRIVKIHNIFFTIAKNKSRASSVICMRCSGNRGRLIDTIDDATPRQRLLEVLRWWTRWRA